MNRDKQIEEIAKEICKCCNSDAPCINVKKSIICDDAYKEATALYNAGYRKASEVARQVIADMREMIKGYENIDVYLDRIEKKYTEGAG